MVVMFTAVLAFLTFITPGISVVPEPCFLVDPSQSCQGLPARNSLYQYPQRLPVDDRLTDDNVMVGFIVLTTGISPPPDEYCVSALKHGLCIVTNPPCDNNTGLLLSICSDSCLAFTRILEEGGCDSVYQYGQELLPTFPPGTTANVLNLLIQFDCTNTSTYIFYDDLETVVDPNHCTGLFTTSEKEQIFSRPNKCSSAPPTPCADSALSQYSHYLPQRSRNTSHLIDQLEGLREAVPLNCTSALTFLSCVYIFPPCDSTTMNVLPLCPELCDNLTALVWQCLETVPENELVTILMNFNCSNTLTYLPSFVHMDQSQCVDNETDSGEADIMSNLAGNNTMVSPNHDVNPGVIAGATVAAVLTLIILIAMVTIVISISLIKKNRRSGSLKPFAHKYVPSISTSSASGSSAVPFVQESGTSESCPTKMIANEDCFSSEVTLSNADRQSYERIFSSVLVPYESLTMKEVIGQGAFGKVYRGTMRGGAAGSHRKSREVAIKTIKNLGSQNEVESFFAESLLMKDFEHPNVLGLTGVCFDTPDRAPSIILPFMSNGSLKDYLKKKRIHVTNFDALPKDLSLSTLVQMCMDVASGMEYLAEKKFVHRDLAARNCMVDEGLTVRVGDFGLARDIYTSHYYRANKEARLPVKWMAPETLNDGISNEKTDMWSYGVTCWEVFSLGRTPYPGIQNHDILRHITTDNQRLERPSLCPPKLYELIETLCWQLLPEKRLRFKQLVQQLQEYWDEEHAYVVEDTA